MVIQVVNRWLRLATPTARNEADRAEDGEGGGFGNGRKTYVVQLKLLIGGRGVSKCQRTQVCESGKICRFKTKDTVGCNVLRNGPAAHEIACKGYGSASVRC